MPLSVFYWVLWLIWVLGGAWVSWKRGPEGYWSGGVSLLLAALLFLIGWKVFGFIVSG